MFNHIEQYGQVVLMAKRYLIHKHIQFYNDQDDKLENFRKSLGAKNTAPIVRNIIDYFFTLPKEKQKKIARK